MKKEHYEVSETKLEAEWEDTRSLMYYYEICSNCGEIAAPKSYPAHGYYCGNYCTNCGAKMKNPHYHSGTFEYEY